jgi:bis(5'-nucleosyl)-tetraphosphatase (symmetrical)
MALYAIGDIQGCFVTLQRLLERIGLDAGQDRLWLVGDLANRGPRSLEVLRWARALGDRLTLVLGNHDLHLIGRALRLRAPKRSDTLEAVLSSPDCRELIDWLRQRPLLHRDGPYVLVHAGLLPEWTLDEAESLAREAEDALRGDAVQEAFDALRGDGAARWSGTLDGVQRLRVVLRALTRLRTWSADGRACRGFSGPPEQAPEGCVPWFEVPDRRSQDAVIVCGHWAALGLRIQPGLIALDTGCVWGGSLTAVRLEDRAVFQEPFAD